MSKSKFDPLEEAKITDDKSETKEKKGLFGRSKKSKKKKAEDAAPEAKAPEADTAPAKVAAAPPPPPPPPAVPTAEPAAEPVPKAADDALMLARAGMKYRVLEDKNASVNGQMTTLRAGKVLEARFYGGLIGLQRILDSGVKVEEC
jgi:hypothetical protein